MTTLPTLHGLDAIRIDPLSPEFETWVEVLDQCMVEEWGRFAPATSVEELRSSATNPVYTPHYLMVKVRGRIAGVALVEAPLTEPDGASRSSFGMVRVLKAVQGYGIGRTLMAAVENEARALGAAQLTAISSARSYRDDRTTRIIRRAGYNEVDTVLRMDLDLSEVATPIADRFPPAHEFQIKTFIGTLPEETLHSLIQFSTSVLTGEALDDCVFGDLDRARAVMETVEQTGRIHLVAVAEERSTGRPIAYSTAAASLATRRSEEGPTVLGELARRQPTVVVAMLARLVDAAHATLQGTGQMRYFAAWDNPDLIGHHRTIGYRDTGFYRDWVKNLVAEGR